MTVSQMIQSKIDNQVCNKPVHFIILDVDSFKRLTMEIRAKISYGDEAAPFALTMNNGYHLVVVDVDYPVIEVGRLPGVDKDVKLQFSAKKL